MRKSAFVRRLLGAAVVLLSVVLVPWTRAGIQKARPAPVDTIEIVGHLALPGTSVAAVTTSEHWRHQFVELRDSAHATITVVDVTDPAQPSIARQLRLPGELAQSSVALMVGDAALLAGTGSRSAAQPGTVSIVSFTDPANPKIVRQFENVTAMRAHAQRGLIYLANAEGLWILQQNPAPDEELENAYARHILYNH